MTFPKQLKQLRQRLGYTQEQAARILETVTQTVSIWERDNDPDRKPHVLTQEGAIARLRDVCLKKGIKPD